MLFVFSTPLSGMQGVDGLGDSLGAFWGVFGISFGPFRAPWVIIGYQLDALGASLEVLSYLLGSLSVLGVPGRPLTGIRRRNIIEQCHYAITERSRQRASASPCSAAAYAE